MSEQCSCRPGRACGLAADAWQHGTLGGYNNWGCRCSLCRKASADYARDSRERRAYLLDSRKVRHGRSSTYINYGCRCPRCRAAATAVRRRQREAATARQEAS